MQTQDNIKQLSQHGRHAISTGQWQQLEQVAVQAIKSFPNEAESHFLMGKALHAQNRIVMATQSFQQALERDPKRYDAAIELANTLAMSKQNKQAANLIQRYQDQLENSPVYASLAAKVYDDIGLPQLAYEFHETAVKLQPEIDFFKSNLASNCVFLGKMERAKELYAELINKNPAHQRNNYFYSRLEKAQNSEHIDAMKDSLAASPQTGDKNIYMYYAIAKELEDLGKYKEAFFYYKMAGDAATQVSNYKVQEDIDIIDTIKQTCTTEWLGNAERVKNNKQIPIFIVGLPRSGTTLLERILSSHSQVSSLGETQFVPMLVRESSQVADVRKISTDIIKGAAASDLSAVGERYLDALDYRIDKSSAYFIDKLPLNFLYIGFIRKMLPEAKIIYMHRHPLDVCFAMYKQVFTWAYKYSYDLENLGKYYIAHLDLLAHWRDVLGDDLIETSYESLVSAPQQTSEEILQQVGLNFEPQCLEFYKSDKPSMTASSVQVRQQIHKDSLAKWKKFENELAPLKSMLENAGLNCD